MNGTRGDNYPNARKERDEIPELSGIRGEFWKLNKNYELFCLHSNFFSSYFAF